MSTANPNLSFQDNIIAQAMLYPSYYSKVVSTQNQALMFNKLVTYLNKNVIDIETTNLNEMTMFRQNNYLPKFSVIKTNTVVGSQVKLTLDKAYNYNRKNDTIIDGATQSYARIVDVQNNGTVLIIENAGSLGSPNSSSFASGSFAAGVRISNLGYTTQPDNGDRYRTSLEILPDSYKFYSQVHSDCLSFSRRDMMTPTWMQTSTGSRAWAYTNFSRLENNFFSGLEVRDLIGIQSLRNGIHTTSGIIPLIINEGTTTSYFSTTDFELSLQQLIETSRSKAGAVSGVRKFKVLCGDKWLALFQQMIIKYVQYAGNTNTFKIDSGLNGFYYNYMNTELEIVPYYLFTSGILDPTISVLFPGTQKSSGSALFIDESPVAVEGSYETVPPISRVYVDNRAIRFGIRAGLLTAQEMENPNSFNGAFVNNSDMTSNPTGMPFVSSFEDGAAICMQSEYMLRVAAPNKHAYHTLAS